MMNCKECEYWRTTEFMHKMFGEDEGWCKTEHKRTKTTMTCEHFKEAEKTEYGECNDTL